MRGPWWAAQDNPCTPDWGADKGAAADGGGFPTMTARDIFLGHPSGSTALVLGFIVHGTIVQFEERERRAQGPGILQPYRDLWKLFHKHIVSPRTGLWLFWAAPVVVPKSSTKSDIDGFLEAAAKLSAASAGRARLIFALDATMSRQATWDIVLYSPYRGGRRRE